MRLRNVLLFAACIIAGSTASGGEPASTINALRQCLTASASADRFSGVLAIGRNGKLTDSMIFDPPATAAQSRFSADTRFNIASAGKMFTAVAIGQLVQAGKLSFDEPVGKVLHGLPADISAVTIDQLLTHRSGLGDYLRPDNLPAIGAARSATDLLPVAIKDGLAFAPGSKQQYSNSGYIVLGAVIERLSGLSYADYVRSHVFDPAGMTTADLAGIAPHAAPMTKHEPDGSLSAVAHPAPAIGANRASSAGGAFVSARDMIKFGEALRSGKLLSRSIAEELWMPRVSGPARDGARVSYGYGFIRMDYPDGRWAVGHGGGSLGINAEFELFPTTGEAIVSLSNYDPPAATEAMAMARRAILAQLPC